MKTGSVKHAICSIGKTTIWRKDIRLLLTACAVCCAAIAAADNLAVSRHAPSLSINWDGELLTIDGDVSSSANESKLRQIAGNHFSNVDRHFEVRRSSQLPPGWSLVTELALQAVAETRSSSTRITPAVVSVDGLTDDFAAWEARASFLSRHLLSGMKAKLAVVTVASAEDPLAICKSLFSSVLAASEVNFAHSSHILRPSAYPLLDELVQIAADCPESIIHITGHTDSSGDEQLNLALSEARAQAVVSYFVSRGIARDRTRATGAGSSSPLNDENNSRSRRRNRRIEITLEDGGSF